LAERQWGTVREDYSEGGDAWSYFPHDHARARAYRWGEDGLAGWSDNHQRLCMGLGLWNGADPILKERLFGLTNEEGNHGEDVKELYWFLDATPAHTYLKMLYKYPHRAFPYEELIAGNRARGMHDPEYDLLDTGIFDDDRYFDVVVEYARGDVDDIYQRVTITNRGPEPHPLHVLRQLWFRNTWSWGGDLEREPHLELGQSGEVCAVHDTLGAFYYYTEDGAKVLFCENETNTQKLYGVEAAKAPQSPKDAFHDWLISGDASAVRPDERGTKSCAYTKHVLEPGEQVVLVSRLVNERAQAPLSGAKEVFEARIADADEFYDVIQSELEDADRRNVQRQAFAGMIWTKQYYYYDVHRWLHGDPSQPKPARERMEVRNEDWDHLYNDDIISMPDTWEYPWYAAWDLAFHCLPLAVIDPGFAKEQLTLLTREWYMHPNGQLPAYEWEFSDVNPPVHAWAAWRVFQIERARTGGPGDLEFLEGAFHKLMLNFTWWVNRKDSEGHNIFQGGFLGLDNIGVFDRSRPLPTGGVIHQSDGTSWMAMYSLNLMRIALELALHNPVYEHIATKFFEHFLHIAKAMTSMAECEQGLWDERDEFYYDVLELDNGRRIPMRVRSMVGLIPLFAVETIEPEMLQRLPGFAKRMEWIFEHRPDLARLVSRWHEPGRGERRLLSLLRGHRMKRLLARMLDEAEFLSPYGVRALSKYHEEHPYVFETHGERHEVRYQPAESTSGLFGGNSNWRGPVWFPVNYLIIESLQRFHHYYGDDFLIEHPAGSGNCVTILDVADDLAR
ncbi:MAG: glucosidase, partial [Myxococcota bacterium]